MTNTVVAPQCIILHGCPPTEAMVTPPENRWMNWVSDRLNEKGVSAIAPAMPTSWQPQYSQWKAAFEQFSVNEETILVGHSCGGAFLVRWLLETGTVVKKLVLVAPAKVPEGPDDTRRDLYDFELPTEIPHLADEVVLFISNDLPHHVQSQELYIKSLNPRVVRLENKVHFLFFQTRTNEFPELLDELLS